MVGPVIASLRRLIRALGRSDVDPAADATFAIYSQEVAHAGVGMAAGALLGGLLGALWGFLVGCLIWAAVQGWQWWQERREAAQGARLADLRGDSIVALGAAAALLFGPLWLAGLVALGLALGRAALRDVDQNG